ncbi:MAG TPA: TonB-dependent receptor, partial [Spirochaetia bacterium]|nr:TonB-dependent receptor [Spirochaetia bacterium]
MSLIFFLRVPGRRFVALALVSLCTLAPLAADEPSAADETPPAPREEAAEPAPPPADLVISATRTGETPLTAPQYVSRMTAEDIAATGKESLPQAVATEAGVTLYSYGYTGSLEQLWLRGATGTRVLVLIDGVPTNNALDGQMSLSLIPKEIIERIEIVQGGMSILYGSHAVGGVINVITTKSAPPSGFLRFSALNTAYLPQTYDEGGNSNPADPRALLDGQKFSLSFGHDFGGLSFFSAGTFEQAYNAYYYPDAGSTAQRENADLLGGSAFSSISIPWETGWTTVSAIYSRNAAGVPGSLQFPSETARQTDDRLQLLAGLHEARFVSDALSLDARLSLTYQERLYDDPATSTDQSKLTGLFAELSQELSVADFFSLIYGGTVTYD